MLELSNIDKPGKLKLETRRLEMSRKEKRQKVQDSMQERSLFDKLPDEMVLTILSYNAMEDIESTRGWQSRNVKHCTETRTKIEAAKNNNLDNLKWNRGAHWRYII